MNLLSLKHSLIVSCQAPIDSPLHNPQIIAAMAQVAINQGAVGVRIDTPNHIQQVRKTLPNTPIIGLWKRQFPQSEVYITPRFQEAEAIAQAGANIIAIDATMRKRHQGETVSEIIQNIQQKLGKLVMADVDTIENAIIAEKAGADLIGTTLYGYTQETQNLSPPGYNLLAEMVKKLQIPILCEGGIATPEMAKKALDLGAYAVVVGGAITGIDLRVKAFKSVISKQLSVISE